MEKRFIFHFYIFLTVVVLAQIWPKKIILPALLKQTVKSAKSLDYSFLFYEINMYEQKKNYTNMEYTMTPLRTFIQ